MKFLHLTLVVCFVTINNFAHAHAHADEDLEEDVLHLGTTIHPRILLADAHAARSLVKSAKKDDDIVIKGPVDPENLSPEFIKKFNLDFTPKVDATTSAPRMLVYGGEVCLKACTVQRMANCLASQFNSIMFQRAAIKNHLRRFIHNKNVRGWFNYIKHGFRIPLTECNVVKIVKCYIDHIPT